MSESFEFTCPACETVLMVSTSLSGTKVSCPKCQNVSVISAPVTQIGTRPRASGHVAAIANYAKHSQSAVGFRCPFCQSNLAPKRKRKISTAGWVTFSLLLVFCFPLCIIGLFIKDEYHVCRDCGVKLD